MQIMSMGPSIDTTLGQSQSLILNGSTIIHIWRPNCSQLFPVEGRQPFHGRLHTLPSRTSQVTQASCNQSRSTQPMPSGTKYVQIRPDTQEIESQTHMVLGMDGGPLVGMLPPEKRSDSLRSKQVSPKSHRVKKKKYRGSIVDLPFCPFFVFCPFCPFSSVFGN